MPQVLNSPLVNVPSTDIWSAGQKTDIVRFGDLGLVMNVHVDAGLYGNGYRYVANFRIIRAIDNAVVLNLFWNTLQGKTGFLDNDIPKWTDFWLSVDFPQPGNASLNGWGENPNGGMYLFKPYFAVDANQYGGDLYRANGLSQFGVAEDHWFWVE
jgi:hypothetical protein